MNEKETRLARFCKENNYDGVLLKRRSNISLITDGADVHLNIDLTGTDGGKVNRTRLEIRSPGDTSTRFAVRMSNAINAKNAGDGIVTFININDASGFLVGSHAGSATVLHVSSNWAAQVATAELSGWAYDHETGSTE